MRAALSLLAALARALPPQAEFALVIAAAFGLFIVTSLAHAIAPETIVLSGARFARTAAYETVVATALAVFLTWRGWRLADLGFVRPRLEDAGLALVLFAATTAATMTLWYLLPPTTRAAIAPINLVFESDGVDLPFVLVFSLINGAFEETFVCAYVLSAWRGASMWHAITVSTAIRLAYHLYQGPLAIVTIGPFGLILAWFYATRGRIWPVIAAHALADVVGLLAYARF
jgi:membrane protease YdiL (CAAX protease family)